MILKNQYIYLFCFVISLFVSGCGSAQVVGRYVENKMPDTGNETLEINNDSTFTYTVLFDVGGTFKFDGRWTLKHNILVLTQSKQKERENDERSNLIEATNPAFNVKRVKVLDVRDSSNIAGAQINFNDADGKVLLTDSDGTVTANEPELRTIRVRMFDIDTTFIVKNSKANDFTAVLNLTKPAPWLKEIPTREWRFKSNKLVSTSSNRILRKVN